MLVYLAPRRYRHEEFLFCQGCRQWIPKPWDGWAPQCDLCGELYETTRFVYVAGDGTPFVAPWGCAARDNTL